jgi:hypothetical protein
MGRQMSSPASIETEAPRDPSLPTRCTISADDARQGPLGQELLFVLGFGTMSAAFAIGVALGYFELLRFLR